ncbi:hypothetical protein DAPPUDRAFT_312148 [Daphnia pulex]|uniref:PEHE domain-containing protein n=1 Tax=Daphnia pulex TaxID=6669 RepID=E9FZ01_DAPPU|nr:hypothetical protein DAPPUDRAFT_312148 [Daphnia pulex]|eukprot:EFX87682.1 hypothetical protein DAPPUDRAFT_312148 [Daphnia pulex]
MLLMRGATSDLKVMAESVDSVGHAVSRSTATTESSFKKTNKNLPASKNNNKTSDNFKSQSPSEDKAIQYGGLPCETDHMYHTNFTDDSSKYRELANEVANLKALVLFHLDLIQQQSECNAAKDKQLSALKHENEMLQQKLERMERRVQLQTSKQKNEVVVEDNLPTGKVTDPPMHQSGSAVVGNMMATRTQSKVSGTSSVPHTPEQQQSFPNCDKLPTVEEIPRKRIKTLLPVRTKPCPSPPPAKRRRTTKSLESSESDDQKPVALPNDNILDDLINQAVEEGAIINLNDSNVPSDHIIEAKVVLEPCSLPSLPVEKESSPSELGVLDAPIHPEHKRIQECLAQKLPVRESTHLKKEVILITEEPYLTHLGESFREPEVVTNEALVEVPRWIIKPLSGRTAAHGIENLDDEVFSKRHLKHEVDEKRRKRWDLQRFREQRRYEKLRARYEGEDRSQDRVRTQAPAELSTTTSGTQCGTLWASPEDVTHIQVEPWLPVSVFGIPLPNIGPADFQLPWSSSRSGDLQEPLTKRRQRRSYKGE